MINIIVFNKTHKKERVLRRIRSFMVRQGRMTKGQKHALNNVLPVMGTPYQRQLLNFNTLFGRTAPVTLEIGFGTGTSLVAMAINYPEQNFIGIEVYMPGVGSCLANAQKYGINNLRVICHDAVEVLEQMIPEESLKLIQLFFPDPWHKARHSKRRIIQASFIELIRHKLISGGVFHMATDCKSYAEHTLSIISATDAFHNFSPFGDYVPRPISRHLTKFEKRGQKLGHNILDLMFKKL